MNQIEEMNEPKTTDTATKVAQHDVEHGDAAFSNDDGSSLGKGDILSQEHTDPVLNAKMHLVNNVSALHYTYLKRMNLETTGYFAMTASDMDHRQSTKSDSPLTNGE